MITMASEIQGLRDVLGRYTRTDIQKAIRPELERLRDRAQALTVSEEPLRTGEMRRRTKATLRTNPIRISVASPVRYTKHVLRGTKPHFIRARRAQALRFTIGDRVVYRRTVFHPGTKPNDFAARALGRLLPELNAAARRMSARIVSSLGGRGR